MSAPRHNGVRTLLSSPLECRVSSTSSSVVTSRLLLSTRCQCRPNSLGGACCRCRLSHNQSSCIAGCSGLVAVHRKNAPGGAANWVDHSGGCQPDQPWSVNPPAQGGGGRLVAQRSATEKAPQRSGAKLVRPSWACQVRSGKPPTQLQTEPLVAVSKSRRKDAEKSPVETGLSLVDLSRGLPGRWQTHDLNIEPLRWLLCRHADPAPGSSGGDTARSLLGIGKPVRCVLTYFI